MCKVLFNGADESDLDGEFALRPYSFFENSEWTDSLVRDVCSSTLLVAGVAREGWFNESARVNVFCKRAGYDMSHLYQARPVPDAWDVARSRSWLDTCLRCHNGCNDRRSTAVPGMCLIDCKDLIIVEVDQTSQWVALSYVWGADMPAATTIEGETRFRPGSRICTKVAATVRDAITVTKQLGYRFLWVDEYCIDQGSDSHLDAQINRMDQIYQGAVLTIVAAVGDDKKHGLPGLGSTKRCQRPLIRIGDYLMFSNGPSPEREARKSKWFSRGWYIFRSSFSSRIH